MPSAIISRLLTLCLVVLGTAKSSELHSVCKPGLEFWSTETSSCNPCTKCAPEFTITPCAVHKDARCGPLSDLDLDWSFFRSRRKMEATQRLDVTNKILWQLPSMENRAESLRRREPFDDFESGHNSNFDEDDDQFEDSQELQILPEVRNERRSDNDSIHLPWDWQTSALVLAVCACIIFFMVAGCSALIYVRQWRQMKRNFEPAGLEEISARLNLMVKAELAELSAGAPMIPGDPETRCQYLEKLLDRKRETPVVAGWPEAGGNLYIEAGNTPRNSTSAELEKVLNDDLEKETLDPESHGLESEEPCKSTLVTRHICNDYLFLLDF